MKVRIDYDCLDQIWELGLRVIRFFFEGITQPYDRFYVMPVERRLFFLSAAFEYILIRALIHINLTSCTLCHYGDIVYHTSICLAEGKSIAKRGNSS